MTVKKAVKYLFLAAIAIAGVLDVYRYIKPTTDQLEIILSAHNIILEEGENIIIVYNAYGGIYPSLADVIHKQIFPNTYPCNLCMQAF